MNIPKSRQSNLKNLASQLFRKLIERSVSMEATSAITLYTFKPGEALYKIGKNARGLFYVSNGLIKIVRPQESGDETMVRLSSEREFLGTLSLVKGYRYTGTAIALNSVEAYKINRDFFMQSLDSDYELGYLFMQYLLESIYNAETRISELINKNVEERIATALLSLYAQDGDGKKVSIPKKDLAMITGSIQETISRKLAKMARKSLIRLKGKDIFLTDLDGLIRLSKMVE